MTKKCCKNESCDVTAETELECKATAALNAEVEAELQEEDKPIEEIIKNAQDTE